MKKCSVNGVEVMPFTSHDELLHYVMEQKGILVAINAEKILHATNHTRQIINRNIGYCDGSGAVMALRKKGYKDVIKIAGCELWLKIIEKFYLEHTFYLIGSKQDVIEETVYKLNKDFPGIQIIGYHNGYISTDELKQEIISDIVTKKPAIVFVAMGSPKQELFMEELQQHHRAVYQGLGGSFDVYTERVKRAPEWWIKHNLEFAYRLIQQPSRIKRQIHLLRFLWLLQMNKI